VSRFKDTLNLPELRPSVDDVRIRALEELVTPAEVMAEFPCTPEVAELVYATRRTLHRTGRTTA
jgi:3-deoxy-D-arabino-heptulosonate 7-phosphate (DAHP) synthase